MIESPQTQPSDAPSDTTTGSQPATSPDAAPSSLDTASTVSPVTRSSYLDTQRTLRNWRENDAFKDWVVARVWGQENHLRFTEAITYDRLRELITNWNSFNRTDQVMIPLSETPMRLTVSDPTIPMQEFTGRRSPLTFRLAGESNATTTLNPEASSERSLPGQTYVASFDPFSRSRSNTPVANSSNTNPYTGPGVSDPRQDKHFQQWITNNQSRNPEILFALVDGQITQSEANRLLALYRQAYPNAKIGPISIQSGAEPLARSLPHVRLAPRSNRAPTDRVQDGMEEVFETFEKIDGDLERAINEWARGMNYGSSILNEGIFNGIWKHYRGEKLIADEIAEQFEAFGAAGAEVRQAYRALQREMRSGRPSAGAIERFATAFCKYVDEASNLKQQLDRYDLQGFEGVKKALTAALDVVTVVAAATGVGALIGAARTGGVAAVTSAFASIGANLATKEAWKRVAIRTLVSSSLMAGVETTSALLAKAAFCEFAKDPRKGLTKLDEALDDMERNAGNNSELRSSIRKARDTLEKAQNDLRTNGRLDPATVAKMVVQITATTLLFEAIGATPPRNRPSHSHEPAVSHPAPTSNSRPQGMRNEPARPARFLEHDRPDVTIDPKWREKVEVIDPSTVRTTQTTIDGRKTDEIAQSFRKNGFVTTPEPNSVVDVVRMPDGHLSAPDNKRIVAAEQAGVPIVARVRNYNDPISPADAARFRIGDRVPKTWGEAVEMRTQKQSPSQFGRENPYGSWSQRPERRYN